MNLKGGKAVGSITSGFHFSGLRLQCGRTSTRKTWFALSSGLFIPRAEGVIYLTGESGRKYWASQAQSPLGLHFLQNLSCQVCILPC